MISHTYLTIFDTYNILAHLINGIQTHSYKTFEFNFWLQIQKSNKDDIKIQDTYFS